MKESRIMKGIRQSEIYLQIPEPARHAESMAGGYGYCKRLNDGWADKEIIKKISK